MLFLINFIIHTVVTLTMTGIIWFVHLIHYPVLRAIPGQGEIFERKHWDKTMKPAVTMLTIEFISSVILLCVPGGIPRIIPLVGLLLVIGIWITTWGTCVPNHCQLKKEYNTTSLKALFWANKIRALLWTVRSGLVCWMLIILIS